MEAIRNKAMNRVTSRKAPRSRATTARYRSTHGGRGSQRGRRHKSEWPDETTTSTDINNLDEIETSAGADVEAAERAAGDAGDDRTPTDVGESTASTPVVAKRSSDSPSQSGTFLTTYFREMASLDVFAPEEELAAAHELEALEIAVWKQLLSYPPMLDYVLGQLDLPGKKDRPEAVTEHIDALVQAAGSESTEESFSSRPPKFSAAMRSAIDTCAATLRDNDTDRQASLALLAGLTELASKPSQSAHPITPIAPDSRAFRAYVGRIRTAEYQVREARNRFVKANLRLVVSIARRFNHGRMSLADLIQEGNIGLMKAVERYDYRRGFRFSTYASWWIRHAIGRALADKGREVRLPVHMLDAQQKLAKCTRLLTIKLGRQPTIAELAEETGMSRDKIEKMRTYLLDQAISLDRPVNDEEGRTFAESLLDTDPDQRSTSEELDYRTMADAIQRTLSELKPIEADILRQRFGLNDNSELTLKQIGARYNLSRERIRQLQEQALTKVRRSLQRKQLI